MSNCSKKRFVLSVDLPEPMYMEITRLADCLNCSKGDIVRWGIRDFISFLTSEGEAPVDVTGMSQAIAQIIEEIDTEEN